MEDTPDLLPLVYRELRFIAAEKLSHERPGQTLQPTALVHEAYLRLMKNGSEQQWNNRGHFFAAAAEAMRRILVENARRRQRQRHGGGRQRVDLETLQLADDDKSDEVLALNEALEELFHEEPQAASVVKLRCFAGLSIAETAEALGISVRTANREWAYAKAWLYDRLNSK